MRDRDLSLRVNYVLEPILFADDTRVIISRRNYEDFCSVSDLVLPHTIKWFAANYLVLNLDKTNIMKFITKNSSHSTLHIGYKEKCIEETVNTKLLILQIENHINWRNCIELIIPKLSGTCYADRSMDHISNFNTLKSIYFAYFHSVMKYGILFWGNSSNSGKIFMLQKQIVRIMAGAQPRTYCRSLKLLETVPVPNQCIL